MVCGPLLGNPILSMDGDKYMHPHLGMYVLKQSFGSLYAHICIHTHARVIRAYVIYSHLHLKNTQVHKYTIQSSMYLYTWNQFLSLSLYVTNINTYKYIYGYTVIHRIIYIYIYNINTVQNYTEEYINMVLS